MDKAAQQDIRTKNDSFAILQNKDAVFKTIHNEIDSLIKVYGKVFDEIIDTFEEEINQKNMGFFPYRLRFFIYVRNINWNMGSI